MITDFASVNTVDTSQCSSYAGSTDTPFEVRRYSTSGSRATPNSLHDGGGEFEILVLTEEEEVDFTDEPDHHHHHHHQQQQLALALTEEESDTANPQEQAQQQQQQDAEATAKRDRRLRLCCMARMFLPMFLMFVLLLTLVIVLTKNKGGSSSSSSPSEASIPVVVPQPRPIPDELMGTPYPTSSPPPTQAPFTPLPPASPPEGEPTTTLPPQPQQAQPQQMNATFVVSNLESITDPVLVNNSGLAEAWPILVQRVLDNGRRRLRHEGSTTRRQLVELQDAYIPTIVLVNCATGSGDDMTCHEVLGVFTLLLDNNEEELGLAELIEQAVIYAIEEGLLDDILQSMDSPLFTGIGEEEEQGTKPTPASTSQPSTTFQPTPAFELTTTPTTTPSSFLNFTEATNDQNLHLQFQYGFHGGDNNNDWIPPTKPTLDQLRELVCETQQWLALAFQERTQNPMIMVHAANITYNSSTATMAFATEITTFDNSPLPDPPFLYSSLDLPMFNFTDHYIASYVHSASPWSDDITEITNYFYNVSSVILSASFQKEPLSTATEEQPYDLSEVTSCESGPLATHLHMEFRFGFEDEATPLFVGPTPAQVSALVCRLQGWLSQQYQTNPNNSPATVVTAQNITYYSIADAPDTMGLSFVAQFGTWDFSPLHISTYYESGRTYTLSDAALEDLRVNATPWDGSTDNYFSKVASGNFTTVYGPARAISSEYALEEATCSAATFENGDVFKPEVTFGFFTGMEPQIAPPTNSQVAAVVCETQRWLSGILQQTLDNPAILLEATLVEYNTTSQTMSFVGTHIETWDGSPSPTILEVITTFDYSNPLLNTTDFILNYVHMASPMDGSPNYYYNVDSFTWVGDFGRPPPSAGPAPTFSDSIQLQLKQEQVQCAPRLYKELFHMTFNYGFFPDSVPTEGPTNAQLAALVCQTQQWLSTALQKCQLSSVLVLQAERIGYQHHNDDARDDGTAGTLLFTADIQTWDHSEVPAEDALELCLNFRGTSSNDHNLNLTSYIVDHVYQAYPIDGGDNYFRDVSQMNYFGDFGPSSRFGDVILSEVTCEML